MKQSHYKILLRYILLLTLGLGNLFIFYKIFSPLTILPTYYLLNLFYNPQLLDTSLIIGSYTIEIIRACIAPSAYYFLLALNLTTPLPLKKRIHSMLFSFTLLLLINIIRITVLSLMFVNQSIAFDFTHKLLWYGLSTIFVIGIWFLTVYQYQIKEIPIYSDFITFRKSIKR
tara:strand:- start:6325 stop:6840 length:516 start_codon:yes stop_codon:yes gene_type:complete